MTLLLVLLPAVLPPIINQVGEALRQRAERRARAQTEAVEARLVALELRVTAIEGRTP